MKHRLKRKSENWRQRLPRPIHIRNGPTLHTLGDCRDYALNLDEGEAGLPHWQHAAKLMMTAATGGSLEDVVIQFERMLMPKNKLVLS
ncbi:MAG: hypothetical protein JWN58_1001 [Gammaproteobacteria bacterium]|nr:hypothetical protein [Gammaproteobacteria bacterium]